MRQSALRLFLLALVLLLPAVAGSQTVTTVLGANIACDPTVDSCLFFPTQGALLCQGSGANLDCPQWFHPDWSQAAGTRFFGITNRTNPPRYLTSSDGITWSLTSVQPFTGAVLNFGAYMAVTSNGSLLAASGQGANLCIIRRSTDQGATWSTVFTSLTQTCSVIVGNPAPPVFYCAETDGYCAVLNISNPATITAIFTTDNGATWNIGSSYAHTSADQRAWGPILRRPDDGIITRGINSLAGQPFGSMLGDDFVATPNYVPAANQNCRPLIMGVNKRAICRPNAGGNLYRVVTGGDFAGAPSEINTFTPADTPITSNAELQPVGYNATYGYMLTISSAVPNRYNVHITSNSWVSSILLQQLTPTTAPIASCCRGNFMRWGNKLYFTTAGTATEAIFGVIR